MNEKVRQPESAIRWLFAVFTLLCLLTAIVCMIVFGTTVSEALAGVGRICTQSGQTVKSYFDASYGGLAGTFLNAALVCADYCVPSGVIAQQEDKDGNITLLRMSDENEVTVPMVVLVNGSTSDGAELFANALRKMNSATIVGTRTAGKGVVMSDAQSFSDGSAAYITIGLLLDNEGQSWNDLGLTPDVDAALSSDEQNAYYDYTVDTDPQISKALNTAKMLSGQN